MIKKKLNVTSHITYFPWLSILSMLIFWYSFIVFFCLFREKKSWKFFFLVSLIEHKICFYFCFHLNKNLNQIEKKVISWNVVINILWLHCIQRNGNNKKNSIFSFFWFLERKLQYNIFLMIYFSPNSELLWYYNFFH